MRQGTGKSSLFGEFISHFNQELVGGEKETADCDYCGSTIEVGERVSMYASDSELSGDFEVRKETGLFVHRMYCGDCDRGHITYPHEGTREMMVSAVIGESGELSEWSYEDFSNIGHGEPWNAKRAYEFMFGEYDEFCQEVANDQQTLSHEDVADMIRLTGLNFREIFDEGGVIVAPESKKSDIRRQTYDRLQIIEGEETPEYENQQTLRRQLGGFQCLECESEAGYWEGVSHTSSCSSIDPKSDQ